MSSDSHLFRTREQMETRGYQIVGNRFVGNGEIWLPLYEAKMIWQFDHRFGTYADRTERGFTNLDSASIEQHLDPKWLPLPFYWVRSTDVVSALSERSRARWLLSFRDVTNSTNERTSIVSLLPHAGVGHTSPLIFTDNVDVLHICGLMANLNTLSFDFIVRQKMGGMHLTFYILRQLPVFSPYRYPPEHLDFIVPRVVELTYTAWDLQAFAQDILDEVGPETWARWFGDAPVHTSPPPEGQPATPAPFIWDEERRARLRAEMDGLYAHLYGLTRDELAYILDTFPIVRRKDEEKYGEYRTKRLVLEQYDELDSFVDREVNMSKLIERLVALEEDVRYQEPATEEEPDFAYTSGTLPILISAPHGAAHTRNGGYKEEDEFTAGIARLVAEKSGAHVIWLRRKSDEDPNNDLESRYKRCLCEILAQHDIRFVIDIHGANAKHEFGIALGTSDGKSCRPDIQNRIVETLGDFGFAVDGTSLRSLAVNKKGFRACGDGTITRYVSKCPNVEAAQFELNAHLRIPQRRADAFPRQHFESRDPALIEKAIEALAELVRVLAETA
jgi:hypothetical protein